MHVPKTGGTSISNWLDIQQGEQYFNFHSYRFNNNKCALQHIPYNNLGKLLDPEIYANYYKFAIVRNPWDRLVSTYKWRKNKNQNFTKFVKFAYNLYKEYGFENLHKYPGFSKHYCAHFYPQYMYVPDNIEELDNFDILRFENLSDDILKVKNKLGINPQLPHLNKTKQDNYKNYYDDETKELVREMYYKDIHMFNYTF